MAAMSDNPLFAWSDNWFCVGPAQAIAGDGDHLTLDLPDRSVTVQNFRGVIAGFLNVCSHRATQMRVCGREKGLLRCPYHGWVYNQKGVPIGIPDNDRLFQLTQADREALALVPVAVAQRGALLFLRLAPEGLPLDEDIAGADSTLVAERVATVDLAWGEILAPWKAEAKASSGRLIAPNLVLQEAAGWCVARYVVPVTAFRSLVGTALFYAEETSLDALPEAVSRIWTAAPGAEPR